MAFYKTCSWCGAHLDPEEICDCRKQKKEAAPVLAHRDGKEETTLHDFAVILHG